MKIKKRRSSKTTTLKTRTRPRIVCPFCADMLPVAQPQDGVFSGDGCVGGRCTCGAAFVVDETGRLGGQALLDAQALLCDGDLDAALRLDSNSLDVRAEPYIMAGQSRIRRHRSTASGLPHAWILRRKKSCEN